MVKEGDTVESGQTIAEIETDKATMEVDAVDEGTVGKILVEAGSQNVPVNSVIAVLLEEDEDASALEGLTFDKPEAKQEQKQEQKQENRHQAHRKLLRLRLSR